MPLGRLAQLGERLLYTQEVTGSSPVPPTICTPKRGRGAVWLARRPVKPEVAGSSPVAPANLRHRMTSLPGWSFLFSAPLRRAPPVQHARAAVSIDVMSAVALSRRGSDPCVLRPKLLAIFGESSSSLVRSPANSAEPRADDSVPEGCGSSPIQSGASRTHKDDKKVAVRGARPRILLSLLVAAVCGLFCNAQDTPRQSTHTDEVKVTRILVDTRVLDTEGHPVEGLSLTNFRVRIGHQRAMVESVEWIPGNPALPVKQEAEPTSPAAKTRASTDALRPYPEKSGRLLIFFFQRDLDRSRIVGLMKMVQRAEELLKVLPPEDQIAVLSYDSRLHLYSDFTTDRDRTRDILRNAIITFRDPGELAPCENPSIAKHFDYVAAAHTASPERALWVLGRALEQLPKSKSLLFFGWGLGQVIDGSFVQLRAEYGTALRSLTNARVTVFSLDVTNADYHSLEGPLRTVALDTGGFYVKTHIFSKIAVDRVLRAIHGHYLLTVRAPEGLPPGRHPLRVSLRNANGNVYARRWVF